MASVTKRGNKWYANFKGIGGRNVQRVTPARTKTEAKAIADELERRAFRQREGLDPLPEEPLPLRDLMAWWRPLYAAKSRAYTKEDFLNWVESHLAPLLDFPLTPANAPEFALALHELLQKKHAAEELAPQSLNLIRFAVFNMFKRASDPKYRKQSRWTGANPVVWVDRFKRRKRLRAAELILSPKEIPLVLSVLPSPSLEHPWMWVFAVMLYCGARPGEALGLRKPCVNTEKWLLDITWSWDQPLPKDDESRGVVIPPELRPLLVAAMEASPSELVFCHPDGSPFDPSVLHGLVDRLRRALGWAGIVDGYRYICRRKGCGFRVQHREKWLTPDEPRGPCCPTCGMRLWESPVPRPLRSYDMRHSHATILRRAKVDAGAVARSLGHSSADVTDAFYDHTTVEDFREDIEAALTFAGPEEIHASSMQDSESQKDEGRDAPVSRETSRPSKSGRQDLNLRPLGPEPSALPG